MELATLLRQRGGRVTQARQAVWDALVAIDGHATVQQIMNLIQDRRYPGATTAINPSSIYRSLQLFDELGLVRESRTDSFGSSTWEIRHPDAHIHLVCERCGEVTHHPSLVVSDLVDELIKTGFEPSGIDVRVDGVCASCTSSGAPKPA